jgi:hypothetical protein
VALEASRERSKNSEFRENSPRVEGGNLQLTAVASKIP